MFSYQNKVVAIKATRTSGSGAIDVLVNNAYVGSITGTGHGANAYFIGSNNSSLNFGTDSISLYPSSVLWRDFAIGGDLSSSGTSANDGYPNFGLFSNIAPYNFGGSSGYFELEHASLGALGKYLSYRLVVAVKSAKALQKTHQILMDHIPPRLVKYRLFLQ